LTANHINLALFNENIPFSYQKIFYSFINVIYGKLIEKNRKKLFKLERIINPHQKKIVPKDKTIYNYEDYKSLFSFATNLHLHKRKAIEDVKRQVNQKTITQNSSNKIKRQSIYNYDSSWLYVLIHLNNAWRHKDVIRFPKINLSELSIQNINLDWLEENESYFIILYVSLACKKRTHASALEVAQRLRAHFDFETTNIYIFIPEEELNDLTHQLFIREHFGYIPDLFAEVLFGSKNDCEQRTKEIVAIKKCSETFTILKVLLVS
jgi:hypothetical protein